MDEDSSAAAQLSALAETTPDVLITIDDRSRIEFVNPAIEDVLGYDPDELLGEPLTRIMPEDLARQHTAALERYLATGQQSLEWDGIELPGQHVDGHQVPLSVSFSEFTLDGERYFTGILRDVTDRQRWIEKLHRLNAFEQDLLDAETVDDVCESAVVTAAEILDLDIAEVTLYDPETAKLRSRASTATAAERPLFPSERGLVWETFVDEEYREFVDRAAVGFDADETPLGSAVLVPIGTHGVFVAGDTATDAVSDTDRRLARTLASTVAAILDRLDRERALRQRTTELEERNEQYRRVQRLNDVIRDITQALLSATAREDVKRVVCEQLADSDAYRFVWFGEHDLRTDAVTPVAWAGAEEGYLDAVEVTAGDGATGQGPAGRAVRSGEVHVQHDLQSDPPFEPWRQEAIKREYRAAIAVPVQYRDTTYGVLVLYAGERDVFTEMEAAVLAELGELVGYGLKTIERYDALVAEDSVELEFLIRDRSNPMVDVLSEHGGRFRLASIGERDGNDQRVFLAFEDIPIEGIRSFADRMGSTDPLTILAETDEETLVSVTLPERTITNALLDRGAVPTELRGTPEEASLTIRIPRSASVREFVELLEERCDDVELLARRESTEPVRSVEQFEQAYVSRLTPRQREVLRVAYFAGFFEQPRKNSARDVAEILDVSQPTISRHIRSAQRTLFSLLFEDG